MPEMANGTPDLVPRPDPTVLTTEQLTREIANLKALLETRLDGMDIATDLLSTTVNRVPSDVDKQVGHLKELHDEKFASITQLIAQRFGDNQKAVDAAFAAQKEAVAEQNKSIGLANDKSEGAFTKQIDSLGTLLATTNKGLSDKIDEIKQQLSSRSGHDTAVVQQQASNQWNTTTVIAVVFGVLSLLISTVVAIVLITHG
jgi:hypothetical protein